MAEAWRAQYTNSSNFSWSNRGVCDAHGICNGCLAQHIEVQVRSEGKWNIRCPGEGCSYLLLYQDVERALQGTDGSVLELLERMRSQSCQGRLKEIVHTSADDAARSWLLNECQPCPECFVVARRETGCNHVKCRCDCDFCVSCGAPMHGLDATCLCPWLDFNAMQGAVVFAAWLRTSWASPCEWLWQPEPARTADEHAHFVSTLGFWLWIAGAKLEPPASWEGVVGTVCEEQEEQPALAPLKWVTNDFYDEELLALDDREEEWISSVQEQELSGHLRKEIYSDCSHRFVRRRARRSSPAAGVPSGTGGACGTPSTVPRKSRRVGQEKTRRWRGKAKVEDLL